MVTSSTSLTINGHRYDGAALKSLCHAKQIDSTLPAWERELYLFIQEWLADGDFVMVHTSGSTGIPKVMQQPKERMVNSALMTQRFFGLGKHTNALLCLPLSYIAGKMMVVRAFVTGMNLIPVEPSSNPFLHISGKVHFAAITPFQLAHSLETLKGMEIEAVIVGGGEIPTDLEVECQGISSSIYATYGMTETSSHVAIRAVNGAHKSLYYEVLKGIEVEVDQRNCLVIKAPDLTPYTLTTNDIVTIKDATHFEWIGRFDSVINSGGVKIFPEQVEKKLFPAIPRRFFVAGLSDKVLGEKVALFIEGEKFSVEQHEHLSNALPVLLSKFEVPRKIVFIPAFDLSDAGKILKKQVVANFHKRR